MAFKLTKSQQNELTVLVEAYETARGELATFLDEIASNWEQELEERSEKWMESERGQEAQERTEKIRGWHEELPDECVIDATELS